MRLKVQNIVQKNAKMGQRGTTSSWSEGKKGYLFPHFPVKCEFSFPWTYRTNFDAFSDIDNFSIISKFQLFDIDNFADILTNGDISAFDNFFPIYRWPLVRTQAVSQWWRGVMARQTVRTPATRRIASISSCDSWHVFGFQDCFGASRIQQAFGPTCSWREK